MNFNIGEKIKLLRKEHSVSQNALAEYLGIRAQTVSKWERGVCAPDIAMLPEIAIFFGIGIDELFYLNKSGSIEDALSVLEKLHQSRKWRETAEKALVYAREFPHDARICEILLNSVVCGEMTGEFLAERDITFAVNLAKRVLNECTDAAFKQKITYHLCVILYEKGRTAEADFYYSGLNLASYTRESLDMYKYRGRELAAKLKENSAVWFNMLARGFSKIAYNIDAGEECLGYLRKAYEYFYAAYESVNERGYLRMCVLTSLDISITYEMMKRSEEAARSFAEAKDLAKTHNMEADFNMIVENAIKSERFSSAGKRLYERVS